MRKQLIFISLFYTILVLIAGCSEQNATNPNSGPEPNFISIAGAYPLAESEDPPIGVPAGPVFILDGPGPFLFQALDLTDEQKERLKEIAVSYREKLEDLRAELRQSGISREAMHEKHLALRQEMYQEMKTILTGDQKTLLAEIESQLQQGIYPEVLIDKRIAHMTAELGLDESQQAALKIIFTDYGAQLLALRGSESDMRTIHIKVKAIMEALRTAITGVLNEEQIALFEARFQENHRHGPRSRPNLTH